MLQQDKPEDFVVATGETHTVREFCARAFQEVGLDYEKYVQVDELYYRPAEVEMLVGNAGKARRELGWEPEYSFEQIITEMIQADLQATLQSQSAPSTPSYR